MALAKEVIWLKCGNCPTLFRATIAQREKLRAGKKRFACTLHCRGQMAAEGLRKKYGFAKLSPKKAARQQVRAAIERGILVRPNACEQCGKRPRRKGVRGIHAHHYAGYDFPLIVKWLCVVCHAEVDAHTKVRGEDHPLTKFKKKDVLKIRLALKRGTGTARGLARLYGVDKKAIQQIRDRKSWRHV